MKKRGGSRFLLRKCIVFVFHADTPPKFRPGVEGCVGPMTQIPESARGNTHAVGTSGEWIRSDCGMGTVEHSSHFRVPSACTNFSVKSRPHRTLCMGEPEGGDGAGASVALVLSAS